MSSPISGFTAIPNPQMLAFMPIQSYLMMFFAGAGWQIGKRKISAIPNDSFNRMSVNDLLKTFTADLKETIPTMERSLQDVTPLVRILVEQYGDFIRAAIDALPVTLQKAFGRDEEGNYPFGKEGSAIGSSLGLHSNVLGFTKIQLQQLLDAQKTPSLLNLSDKEKASALADIEAKKLGYDPSTGRIHYYKGRYYTQARLQQLIDVKQRSSVVQTAKVADVTKFQSLTEKSRPSGQRLRLAGQSQRLERASLLATIRRLTKDANSNIPSKKRADAKKFLIPHQQQLALLLQRYRF